MKKLEDLGINIHWGFIIESIILSLIIGMGIESCGKHIGEGISQIRITIVKETK